MQHKVVGFGSGSKCCKGHRVTVVNIESLPASSRLSRASSCLSVAVVALNRRQAAHRSRGYVVGVLGGKREIFR